jgi:hypothetical protein
MNGHDSSYGGSARRHQRFADLRARNERRATLATSRELRRRQQIERVMLASRQHRFRQRG